MEHLSSHERAALQRVQTDPQGALSRICSGIVYTQVPGSSREYEIEGIMELIALRRLIESDINVRKMVLRNSDYLSAMFAAVLDAPPQVEPDLGEGPSGTTGVKAIAEAECSSSSDSSHGEEDAEHELSQSTSTAATSTCSTPDDCSSSSSSSSSCSSDDDALTTRIHSPLLNPTLDVETDPPLPLWLDPLVCLVNAQYHLSESSFLDEAKRAKGLEIVYSQSGAVVDRLFVDRRLLASLARSADPGGDWLRVAISWIHQVHLLRRHDDSQKSLLHDNPKVLSVLARIISDIDVTEEALTAVAVQAYGASDLEVELTHAEVFATVVAGHAHKRVEGDDPFIMWDTLRNPYELLSAVVKHLTIPRLSRHAIQTLCALSLVDSGRTEAFTFLSTTQFLRQILAFHDTLLDSNSVSSFENHQRAVNALIHNNPNALIEAVDGGLFEVFARYSRPHDDDEASKIVKNALMNVILVLLSHRDIVIPRIKDSVILHAPEVIHRLWRNEAASELKLRWTHLVHFTNLEDDPRVVPCNRCGRPQPARKCPKCDQRYCDARCYKADDHKVRRVLTWSLTRAEPM